MRGKFPLLSEPGIEMKSLYEVTGNVCDINTMLINKAELDDKLKQCRDAAIEDVADAMMKSDLSGLAKDHYLLSYTAQLILSWVTYIRTLKNEQTTITSSA